MNDTGNGNRGGEILRLGLFHQRPHQREDGRGLPALLKPLCQNVEGCLNALVVRAQVKAKHQFLRLGIAVLDSVVRTHGNEHIFALFAKHILAEIKAQAPVD